MAERVAGPGAGEKTTLVEDGTEFKGSFTSKCPIVVRGRIEGEIAAPSLMVSVTGSVHGRAKVGQIRSEGELSGEFDADVIELSGKVKDNTVIRARSLDVKLSSEKGKMQVVFGECTLEVGDEPGRVETGVAARSLPSPPEPVGPLLGRKPSVPPEAPPNGGAGPSSA